MWIYSLCFDSGDKTQPEVDFPSNLTKTDVYGFLGCSSRDNGDDTEDERDDRADGGGDEG